jgi:hypothetical protein
MRIGPFADGRTACGCSEQVLYKDLLPVLAIGERLYFASECTTVLVSKGGLAVDLTERDIPSILCTRRRKLI